MAQRQRGNAWRTGLAALVLLGAWAVQGCGGSGAPTASPTPAAPATILPPAPAADTPTPIFTPELTPAGPERPSGVVKAPVAAVRIRVGPGTSYATTAIVVDGDQVTITGQAAECRWYEVETQAQVRGWLTANYLVADRGCGELMALVPAWVSTPVAGTIGTPTPEPTVTLTVTLEAQVTPTRYMPLLVTVTPGTSVPHPRLTLVAPGLRATLVAPPLRVTVVAP